MNDRASKAQASKPAGGSKAPASRGTATKKAKQATAAQETTLSASDLASAAAEKLEIQKHRVVRKRVENPHPKVNSKLFVLDTNVFMHDPSCIYRFEEHDIYVPMMTLEELDNNKKGMSDASRNARQISRMFDEIIQTHDNGMDSGVDLSPPSGKIASGRLFFQSEAIKIDLPEALPSGKGDNQILAVVLSLKQRHASREVILVSKDINIRIKARALGLVAEDYLNDQTIDDSDLLPTGACELDSQFWAKQGRQLKARHDPNGAIYEIKGEICESLSVNEFVYVEKEGFAARVINKARNGATLRVVQDFSTEKSALSGIMARNLEQNFAINLLMDRDVDFVTLLGQAGTGKTLLTLAAGIEQVVKRNFYNEIIVTRATVSMGEDIGFLPGSEEEKMAPWMGAIEDNLDALLASHGGTGPKANALNQIRSKIKVKSMNFMRGRTFHRKFVIIDEAQNLTPKQMKALVTRAGPGTKLVCLGNLQQIDTPYLTEGSSGLTYVVDRFRNWAHAGHLTLKDCERSRLADYAGEVL